MPSSIHKPSRDALFCELFESAAVPATLTDDPESLYNEYREIGHGNFGSVYYAVEKSTNEVVAVKKMSIASNSSLKDSRQKYDDVCREIRALKTLAHHPNLLAFRRAHCDLKQGLILLVTEYCLGSCADVLETLREIDEREISAIVSQCLAGLVYVHSNGAIHRDVKASNILIGEGGVVKLADFGSASSNSNATSFVGTPFWIAPEVILAMDTGQYDTRADVWSLGITCHEFVDGRPPYFSLNPMSALYQIAHNEPPRLALKRKRRRDARKSAASSTEDSAETEASTTEEEVEVVFSDAFRDFVNKCLQKEPSKRPSSDELFNSHPFVMRNEAETTAVSYAVLLRTRTTLSVTDPQKHRRIRENFNADAAGSPAVGYENLFANQLVRDSAHASRQPVSIEVSNARVCETVTEDGEDSCDTLLNEAIGELDAHLHVHPEVPHSATSSFVEQDADRPRQSATDSASFDTDADPDPPRRNRLPESDAKFATLKTKNMLRRELEESQKYVNIREKFAALKRLRIAQQKELKSLDARCELEHKELRTRLAKAYEDAEKEANKEIAKMEERQKVETDKRERDPTGAWKRAYTALQKLRKRTLNAGAGGLRFGSLAKGANRNAVETVAHAEARLKAIERLKLLTWQRFAAQYAGELRARKQLALEDSQRLLQTHIEQIENEQLSRVENIYRTKQTHLERLFDMERENHAAFFRGESEKLMRSHERRAKELAKNRKIIEAVAKRETDTLNKSLEKEWRAERARIESDNSLGKSERDAAVRTAKDRYERRRADELAALRRRTDTELDNATRKLESTRDSEQRALEESTRNELELLMQGQQVARNSLDVERNAELDNEKQRAAANQRDIDSRFSADREAMRQRCDDEACALRDSHAAAIKEFDNRALTELTALHNSLIQVGASQYSSTANLQPTAQAVPASAPVTMERRFVESLYFAYVEAITPRDADSLSASDLLTVVLQELDRFCAANLNDPQKFLVAVANNRAQTAAPSRYTAPTDTSGVQQSQNGKNDNNNGDLVKVRLRNDNALGLADVSKRNSMVVLSSQNAEQGAVYDYNGANARALPNTPTKAGPPAFKASLMQLATSGAHVHAHHPNSGSGAPLLASVPTTVGSAGRKGGAEMLRSVTSNGGSPSSSTSGSSRLSGALSHKRRLFGIFNSSHNVNEPNAANSDSNPLGLNVPAGYNSPRSRLSVNISGSPVSNWQSGNSSTVNKSNTANDNTQM